MAANHSLLTIHYSPFNTHFLLWGWGREGRGRRLQEFAGVEHRTGRCPGGRAALRLERHGVGRAVDGHSIVVRKLRALRELLVADQPERARRLEAVGDEPQLVGLARLALGPHRAHRQRALVEIE